MSKKCWLRKKIVGEDTCPERKDLVEHCLMLEHEYDGKKYYCKTDRWSHLTNTLEGYGYSCIFQMGILANRIICSKDEEDIYITDDSGWHLVKGGDSYLE